MKNAASLVVVLGICAGTTAQAQDVTIAPDASFAGHIVVPPADGTTVEAAESPARTRHWGTVEGMPSASASQSRRRGGLGLDFLSASDVGTVGGLAASAAAWVLMSATGEGGAGGGTSAASTTR